MQGGSAPASRRGSMTPPSPHLHARSASLLSGACRAPAMAACLIGRLFVRARAFCAAGAGGHGAHHRGAAVPAVLGPHQAHLPVHQLHRHHPRRRRDGAARRPPPSCSFLARVSSRRTPHSGLSVRAAGAAQTCLSAPPACAALLCAQAERVLCTHMLAYGPSILLDRGVVELGPLHSGATCVALHRWALRRRAQPSTTRCSS